MKVCIIVVCLIFAAVNCYALGETKSMICKSGIVSPGDDMMTVIKKCGLPANRLSVWKRYKFAGKSYSATEQWLYNFGPNEFMYYAIFNGSQVVLLYSSNDYGY